MISHDFFQLVQVVHVTAKMAARALLLVMAVTLMILSCSEVRGKPLLEILRAEGDCKKEFARCRTGFRKAFVASDCCAGLMCLKGYCWSAFRM